MVYEASEVHLLMVYYNMEIGRWGCSGPSCEILGALFQEREPESICLIRLHSKSVDVAPLPEEKGKINWKQLNQNAENKQDKTPSAIILKYEAVISG